MVYCKMTREINSYLVAFNAKTNAYFGVEESFAATSPQHLASPLNAKKFPIPHDGKIHPAKSYFENSDRMRSWLKGYKMIKIRIINLWEII